MIQDPSFDVFNLSSGLNSNVCFVFSVFTFYQLKSRCWIDNCNDVVFDSFLTCNALYKVLFLKDDVQMTLYNPPFRILIFHISGTLIFHLSGIQCVNFDEQFRGSNRWCSKKNMNATQCMPILKSFKWVQDIKHPRVIRK